MKREGKERYGLFFTNTLLARDLLCLRGSECLGEAMKQERQKTKYWTSFVVLFRIWFHHFPGSVYCSLVEQIRNKTVLYQLRIMVKGKKEKQKSVVSLNSHNRGSPDNQTGNSQFLVILYCPSISFVFHYRPMKWVHSTPMNNRDSWFFHFDSNIFLENRGSSDLFFSFFLSFLIHLSLFFSTLYYSTHAPSLLHSNEIQISTPLSP